MLLVFQGSSSAAHRSEESCRDNMWPLSMLPLPSRIAPAAAPPVAAMFTVTLVVGGVLHVQNTDVPPLPFSRDVIFLAASLLLIIWSAVIGEVSVSFSFSPIVRGS